MFGGCFQWQPLLSLSYTCGRCVTIASNSKSNELEINEQIRDKEIRLIGADGAQMGIMSPRDALKMAIDKDLDLVKVAPQAKPPVCKILDYGKYRFEMQKKEKEAKKNQKVVELKEIRLSLNIDTNDFNTKVNQAAKFLQQGSAAVRWHIPAWVWMSTSVLPRRWRARPSSTSSPSLRAAA